MRKLIYLVAVSADGFIADENGAFDAFPQHPDVLSAIFTEYPETCPSHVRAALGITSESRHFDTVVMGARTHQPALDAGLTSAYPHLRQFVVTHRTDLPADPTVTVVPGDPAGLVAELKQQAGQDIWLCGGGDLAGQLAPLVDEVHLKVNPVLFGRGVPLFRDGAPGPLGLLDSRELGQGVLLNRYRMA